MWALASTIGHRRRMACTDKPRSGVPTKISGLGLGQIDQFKNAPIVFENDHL
jgi:hypothetical protein